MARKLLMIGDDPAEAREIFLTHGDEWRADVRSGMTVVTVSEIGGKWGDKEKRVLIGKWVEVVEIEE